MCAPAPRSSWYDKKTYKDGYTAWNDEAETWSDIYEGMGR
jgi:hypothetical protein